MDLRWLMAFVDLPASVFDVGLGFWRAVTQTARSPAAGDHDEFVTLVPAEGDAHLGVQRVGGDGTGVHLDLHVADLAAARATAVAAGATVVAEPDHIVLASPAGLGFCLVPDQRTPTPAPPVAWPRRHAVDQLCIDVPAPCFDDECGFWARLTGTEPVAGALAEFRVLPRRRDLPLRLLLQRLGEDDPADVARAHLDLACGSGRHEIARAHVGLGATHVAEFPHWIAMRDPTGLPYCLTGRDPLTGRLDR